MFPQNGQMILKDILQNFLMNEHLFAKRKTAFEELTLDQLFEQIMLSLGILEILELTGQKGLLLFLEGFIQELARIMQPQLEEM